jgi:hypothetical protein
MSAYGTKRTSRRAQSLSAFGGKADIGLAPRSVRFWPKAVIDNLIAVAGF